MKNKFSRRYQAALFTYLKQGSKARLQLAHGMGNQALAVGLQTLDLAKLHEKFWSRMYCQTARAASVSRSSNARELFLPRRSSRSKRFIAARWKPPST